MRLARTVTAFLTLAIGAMVVSDALAQGGGGRGRRGGPGGFGRPGGGPGGDSLLGLLQVEEVREELNGLEPFQDEALKKLEEQMRDSRRETLESYSDVDRSEMWDRESEVGKKLRKEMDELEMETRAKLEEVLFPEQMDRLQEIQLQQQGVAALRTDRVAEELELTSEQKQQFEQITQEAQETRMEQMSKIREFFQSGDREKMREVIGQMREKMEKLQEQTNEKMLGVLTAEQKKEFEEMKGEAFEMPEPERRGGFRGRGGPRGGFGGDRGGRRGGRGDREGRDNER